MRAFFLILFIFPFSLGLLAQDIITQDEKAKVIKKVSNHLEKHYILVEEGNQMSALIKQNFDQGEYDEIEDHLEFSQRINRDIKSIYSDKHLALVYEPWAEIMRDSVQKARRLIKKPKLQGEVLEGNIGLISIGSFDFKAKDWDILMFELIDCKALIIDLRGNSGGYESLVNHALSYFLKSSTHFSNSISRKGEENNIHTKKKIKGERRLEVPIMVLIDQHTFSAGEALAYHLQSFKRAEIIGENSAGGAFPKRNYKINKNYFLSISVLRIVNSKTKTDWEGIGINPDISTSSEAAFDRAYRKSLNF